MALDEDWSVNSEQYWCHASSTDDVAISSPQHLFQISKSLNHTSSLTSSSLPT
ncbi:hypothetical protein AGABI1DRAFT_86726 [Agaricus bisporus var. burnettii JB137-S8]|uniref:Uncharacterized protein n=1 Tax=Agaricus bisporus var. burnettii (strain JB137-S8 / ATCC MYA-4627 / FGSC 10392) TaxID=597362 RepID=K5VRQ8_AGABU|nr:uncharacterized protein AGABI1DRAFT_86726 [Agaricus bisporus var. burnettii JB137-S8]EKM77129.1 hypothetical protein AGABI1DRAFT_86726 [Agaricus bisporus var. burnettii JB137-S8]